MAGSEKVLPPGCTAIPFSKHARPGRCTAEASPSRPAAQKTEAHQKKAAGKHGQREKAKAARHKAKMAKHAQQKGQNLANRTGRTKCGHETLTAAIAHAAHCGHL